MKHKIIQLIFMISLLLNCIVTLPVMVLFSLSSAMRFQLYQEVLAPRFGYPEIVFLGDSLTRDGEIWGLRIGEYNFNTWNMGHEGLTTRQIGFYVSRLEHYKPKYVFVMAGINDHDKSKQSAFHSFLYYKKMLDKIRGMGSIPVIQLTLYRENEQHPEFIDTLNHSLQQYAKQYDLSVIDLNPILSKNKSLLVEYSRDGTHLTEAAYEVWSEKIVDLLDADKRKRGF